MADLQDDLWPHGNSEVTPPCSPQNDPQNESPTAAPEVSSCRVLGCHPHRSPWGDPNTSIAATDQSAPLPHIPDPSPHSWDPPQNPKSSQNLWDLLIFLSSLKKTGVSLKF